MCYFPGLCSFQYKPLQSLAGFWGFREHSLQTIAKTLLGVRETHHAQLNSLRNGGDSDIEQIENDFKDPEDGLWDKNNSEGIISNSEVPVNLDIRGECRFACVQL